jgi:hypothetical protein
MSVNKYLPHVLVLPEDDANRQLANGFHVSGMRKYTDRFMVLLIDFDDHLNRLKTMKDSIPEDLLDRVFILGTLSKPEALRQAASVPMKQLEWEWPRIVVAEHERSGRIVSFAIMMLN